MNQEPGWQKIKDLGSGAEEEEVVSERNIHCFGDCLEGEDNKYVFKCREKKL